MPYGTGLDTAFNQDEPQQNINTHPKKVKTPEGLEKTTVDYDKIQHLKVGEMVAYTKGQGTIVRKDGAYVTIFNEDAGAYDQVHAGETYIPGDTISMGIMNQLWDQMSYETRMASLHKAEVQEPLHFVDRKWNELPSNLKEVIQKKSPTYTSVGPKYQGGRRPTSIGNEGAQERSAFNPGGEYAGGGGASRTFTPGGRKTKPKENLGPESKRKPAGEGAGPAAEAAAERSTGKPKKETYTSYGYGVKDVPAGAKQDVKPSKQKPAKQTSKPKEDGGVTFASGLDKATSYGELATEIYRLRNQLNKQFLGGKEDPFDKKLIGGSQIKRSSELDAAQRTSREHLTHNTPSKPHTTVIEGWEGDEEYTDNGLGSVDSFKKSDVEHGAYGGVVTDTPFDAEGDYEEDKRDVHGKEFDHNHQQKTPRDPKEDGKEVLVGYHSKEGHGGSMSTGTEGANNPVANTKKEEDEEEERSISNKNNTRYGIRKASKEDIERLTK